MYNKVQTIYLDGKWHNFEANYSGSHKLGLVLMVSHNNADVIEQIVLRLLLLGCGSHESHRISSGDIAQLVIAHSHWQTVQQPMNSELCVNHGLEHLNFTLFMSFPAKNNTSFVLFHSQLIIC